MGAASVVLGITDNALHQATPTLPAELPENARIASLSASEAWGCTSPSDVLGRPQIVSEALVVRPACLLHLDSAARRDLSLDLS